MSAVLKSAFPSEATKNREPLFAKFATRKSDELVVALAGPIGCGIGSIVDGLTERLKEHGYQHVVRVKLSKFLEEAIAKNLVPTWTPSLGASARLIRYRRLQDAGKQIRRTSGNPAILAEYAAQEIALDRTRRHRESNHTVTSSGGPIVPGRIAYVIDQLKRPEEVALLRAVYRNLFYLVGITRINDRRVDALKAEQVRGDEVQALIDIDRLEDNEDGQQLDKTLHLADYFIRNDAATIDEKRQKLTRFVDLIHGDKSVTPTDAEHGMYAAYCASLRSACLSRQVGAAIASPTGEVIATGCNDVPQATGGLYSASSARADRRCVHLDEQRCFNDLHKQKLQSDIGDLIDEALRQVKTGPLQLPAEDRATLLNKIYKDTRLKDLIEFSRSVHAEMDAIVSVARLGGNGLQEATLYTTTFPCHNCARHIVASGIMKVYYIEPYEKSLAKDLHRDAIAFEVEESSEDDKKPKRVEFLHFEGASPKQFVNLFRATGRKDTTGKFIPIKPQEADKVVPEYLDNYQDFESKAVEHLNEELKMLAEKSVDKSQPETQNSPT
ncbi:MAG: anti-phage dCTP deaminase [Ramlibacter sp.]